MQCKHYKEVLVYLSSNSICILSRLGSVSSETSTNRGSAASAESYEGLTVSHVEHTVSHEGRTVNHVEQTVSHEGLTVSHVEQTVSHEGRTVNHVEQTVSHVEDTDRFNARKQMDYS